jgi:hypothetical protein
MKLSKTWLALLLPLSLVWACGSSGDTGSGSNTGASSTGASAGSGAASGSLNLGGDGLLVGGDATGATSATGGSLNGTGGSRNGTGGVVATGTTACSDGKDNDGDGLIDGFDPECTGPADNDEGTFATGIPGDNKDPKWQDCFFDGNSGAGDDGCRYATGCLTGALPPDDKDCTLTAACIKFCAPLVPNGCDCFGCCTVQLPTGGRVDIETASSCSLDKVDDAKACPRCVKSDACGNTCGRCELCPGKTIADLPDDCGPTGSGGAGSGTGGTGTGGGPSYTCDGGEQVCGPGLPTCGLGLYCSLGCCLVQPPK